jgi:myo-inositol catabolism protein IolC
MNRRQAERLARLSDYLHKTGRKYMFELLVPAEKHQLEAMGGDSKRYDREMRPGLMVRAIESIQRAGIEPDVWKIEGLDRRADCEAIAAVARAGGRSGVACVVLGRGANAAAVEHWVRQGAGVAGYIGFAIGRTIWWDPLKAYLDRTLPREDAAKQIGATYAHLIDVYGNG